MVDPLGEPCSKAYHVRQIQRVLPKNVVDLPLCKGLEGARCRHEISTCESVFRGTNVLGVSEEQERNGRDILEIGRALLVHQTPYLFGMTATICKRTTQ